MQRAPGCRSMSQQLRIDVPARPGAPHYPDTHFQVFSFVYCCRWDLKSNGFQDTKYYKFTAQIDSDEKHGQILVPRCTTWQAEPPLPISVTIDISPGAFQHLGWEVIQRNGRIWMVEQNNRVTKIDAAKYHMLLTMYQAPAANTSPTAISKPGYYYDTIMTFGINYVHYDTIMTLLLHLSLLQKTDYYYTLSQNPGKHYYYTYDSSIIAIMNRTFRIFYDTYGYYYTIVSIIAFVICNYDKCETLCALRLLYRLSWYE